MWEEILKLNFFVRKFSARWSDQLGIKAGQFAWCLALKVYMTDFFICSIKSPQCTDKNNKTNISIAIFLPNVLMCQKRQISLPVGYKTARQKQETGNDCYVISGLEALRKTDFSVIF